MSETRKRKGGRVKATWWGKITRVGRTLVHHYSEDGRTCTGMTQYVLATLTLDREPDRNVCVRLTVADARKWANALNVMADKVENEGW